jgi:hypothetical protein
MILYCWGERVTLPPELTAISILTMMVRGKGLIVSVYGICIELNSNRWERTWKNPESLAILRRKEGAEGKAKLHPRRRRQLGTAFHGLTLTVVLEHLRGPLS